MRLTKIPAPDFDLEKTLNSGQVFHWEKIDNRFVGAIGDCAVRVEQRGDQLLATGPADLVRDYFALDHPLAKICRSFPKDDAMKAAKDFCRGLRIIRQPKWECLAMFICSTFSNISRNRQIAKALRERFGDTHKMNKSIVYTFPQVRRIAQSSEKELLECRLGYRAKYLLATARLIASGDVDLEQMTGLSDDALRRRLDDLPGVGPKVANCVMLFAYERLQAFPIDVWIERVLREKYFPRARKLNASRLRRFTEEYFGEHGGYAQQYLFHHARMTKARA